MNMETWSARTTMATTLAKANVWCMSWKVRTPAGAPTGNMENIPIPKTTAIRFGWMKNCSNHAGTARRHTLSLPFKTITMALPVCNTTRVQLWVRNGKTNFFSSNSWVTLRVHPSGRLDWSPKVPRSCLMARKTFWQVSCQPASVSDRTAHCT